MEDFEYEVVWSGGLLLPERPTKTGDIWSVGRYKRKYNKIDPNVWDENGVKIPKQERNNG